MDSATEGEVVTDVRAVESDLVRVGEAGLVPVGRSEEEQECGARRQGRPRDRDLSSRDALEAAVRRVVTKRFLDDARDDGPVLYRALPQRTIVLQQ
jgi:hypothetical protein